MPIIEAVVARESYQELPTPKGGPSPEVLRRLDELEHQLDTFNIGINRERAEAAAEARRKVRVQRPRQRRVKM